MYFHYNNILSCCKGIGRDTAKALYAAGAVTYALSKTQANLDSLKAEVRLRSRTDIIQKNRATSKSWTDG